MRQRTPFSQRSRGEYSLLSNTSQNLYEAYKSNSGMMIQGALEGSLGATIAAMSSVADEKMLGIHAALSGIWTALTTKNFAEAGHKYLHKREEDIENIGIGILTYAKLKSGTEAGLQSENFTSETNQEIAGAISSALVKKIAPDLSEEEIEKINSAINSKEAFEDLIRDRSQMVGGKFLATSAAIGIAAIIGGVGTMVAAGSNVAAFNSGIAIAGAGAFVFSTVGGLANASASNSQNISSAICEAIQSLSEQKFNLDQIHSAKSEVIAGLEREKENSPSTSTRNINTLNLQELSKNLGQTGGAKR